MISFDYPFSGGWHELCVCYKNTGWTLHRSQGHGAGAERRMADNYR